MGKTHLADKEALDADAGLARLVVAAVHKLRDDRVQLCRGPAVVSTASGSGHWLKSRVEIRFKTPTLCHSSAYS